MRTTEEDGHVHDWRPDYTTTSVNYHVDRSTPGSFHVHALVLDAGAVSSAMGEGGDWHTHALTEEES